MVNSLRLMRVGAAGIDRIRPPAVLRGFRGFVASVLVPVVLFAAGTVVTQIYSPSRGQSLLPVLYDITTVSLPGHASAEVYLNTAHAGVLPVPPGLHRHSGTPSVGFGTPRVVAVPATGSTVPLRIVRLSADHYIAYTVLGPGRGASWSHVAEGTHERVFSVERTLS